MRRTWAEQRRRVGDQDQGTTRDGWVLSLASCTLALLVWPEQQASEQRIVYRRQAAGMHVAPGHCRGASCGARVLRWTSLAPRRCDASLAF